MRNLIAAVLILAITGCTSVPHRPIVDHGVSTGNYEQDLFECQKLAEQKPSRGKGAAAGALMGAILGAALGQAAGLDSNYTARLAATGAVSGVVAGGAPDQQAPVVTRCIQARGWKVVG